MTRHHLNNAQIIAAIVIAAVVVVVWVVMSRSPQLQRIDTVPPSTLCMIEGDTRCNVPWTPTP